MARLRKVAMTWGRAGADLGGVFGGGDIAQVIQRLDGPVPAQQVGQAGGAGLVEGKAGDRIHDHGPPTVGVKATGLAGGLDDLGGVRKPEVADGDRVEGARLDAAVAGGLVGLMTNR
jgi:hypothetical protein